MAQLCMPMLLAMPLASVLLAPGICKDTGLACRNPLFRVHWYSKDCQSCPSMLNEEPRVSADLRVCPHWRGLEQCCNPTLEHAQEAAFAHWKDAFGQFLTEMRTYLAQMLMRQLTAHYRDSSLEHRQSFDEGIDALHEATAAYPKCMQSLLQYSAGMICFMCDPQWGQFLYRRVAAEAAPVQEVYQPGTEFNSISVGTSTCTELWGACQEFAKRATEVRRRVVDCPLAKQISAPLPDLDMFMAKPALCAWARDRIAHHPMLEAEMVTPQPTMPGLPPDALITPEPTTWDAPKAGEEPPLASRRLEQSQSISPSGFTHIAVAFRVPNEVRAGRASADEGLSLSTKLGGAELKAVQQVAVDDRGKSGYFYFATAASAEYDEVVQYKYVVVNGEAILEVPTTVWPSAGVQKGTVTQMRTYKGDLFLATSLGHVLRLGRNGLGHGTRTDGEPLFSTETDTEKKEEEAGQEVPPRRVSGLAVQDALFFSTSTEVYMATRGGPAEGTMYTLLNSTDFVRITGDPESTIKDIEVNPSGDTVYMVVYMGVLEQETTIYRFPVDNSSNAMRLDWGALTDTLRLTLAEECLYVASIRNIYCAPPDFHPQDEVKMVYALSPGGNRSIADVALYFVAGTDCLVSDWQTSGHCSKSCGGGLLLQKRTVLTKAANGGRACPSVLERHVKCNPQACPDISVDCKLSPWLNEGTCSTTCGAGQMLQKRSVLREGSQGGNVCPKHLSRTITCNVGECGVLDFVAAATKLPSGLYTAQVEGIDGYLQMEKVSANSDRNSIEKESLHLLAVDSTNHLIYASVASGSVVWQWSCSVGEGDRLSAFSPRKVWESKAARGKLDDGKSQSIDSLKVIDMLLMDGSLYILTSNGQVIVVPSVKLLDRYKAPSFKVLYSDTDPRLGKPRYLAVAGKYVAWASALHATLGSVEGSSSLVEELEIIRPEYLRTLAGVNTVEIVDAKLTVDARDLFMLIWDTSSEALGLYACAVTFTDQKQSRQLRFTWSSRELRLVMSPLLAFVYGTERVWSVPLDLSADDASPTEVYKATSSTSLTTLAYFWLRGNDCVMSDWDRTTTCSKTCGGGLVTEARKIVKQPTPGGRACPVDLIRKVPCNENRCPVNCRVSAWRRIGNCSKPCDGGVVKQVRQVLQPDGHGGDKCPDLERTAACNEQPCAGIDCRFSEWTDDGRCSKSCGAGRQRQYRRVVRKEEFGGRPCAAEALSRQVACNLTPCQQQGFDPIAAGKLTGFNFDIAQYCENPALCKISQAYEYVRHPFSSKSVGFLSSRFLQFLVAWLSTAWR